MRLHSREAGAFPIQYFPPLSQEISAYTRNHKPDSKRCSIPARPVYGAVIMPQRYTKNVEEEFEFEYVLINSRKIYRTC